MHYAAHQYAAGTCLSSIIIMRLLIDAGGEMLGDNNEVVSSLDICCEAQEFPERAIARVYFQQRPFALQNKRFREGHNDTLLFKVAAYFLDLRVFTIFKEQWHDALLAWRDKDGRNLLMVALMRRDLEAVRWLIENNVIEKDTVDEDKHNALWYAAMSCEHVLVNEVLKGGEQVTEQLVREAIGMQSCFILVHLLMKWRYGVSLFK